MSVPVYLGNIDLIHRYFYDVGVRIVHMLLMSWAGEVAEDGDTANLKGEVQRSVQWDTGPGRCSSRVKQVGPYL